LSTFFVFGGRGSHVVNSSVVALVFGFGMDSCQISVILNHCIKARFLVVCISCNVRVGFIELYSRIFRRHAGQVGFNHSFILNPRYWLVVLYVYVYVCVYVYTWRTAVAQCATNRKVAGSIPASVIGFFIDIQSFRSHYGPGVDIASNRNEYLEHSVGVKAAGK
jgi:hypothetical protein